VRHTQFVGQLDLHAANVPEPTRVTLPQNLEREAETLRTVKLLWSVLRLLNLLPGVS